jgi:parallel beta-helix repeat protein
VSYKILYILLFTLLLSASCRENSISNDDGPNSGLAGDYTEISGDLSGTLSLTDSPFLVTGDVNIKVNDTLIIEAGVILFIENDKKINVTGTIIAEGTSDKMITFRSFGDTNEDWWHGVRITNATSLSRFKFCIIEHVNQNINDQFTNGAIEIDNSKVVIENCVFRTNYSTYGGGFSAFNSDVTLMNNIFRNNNAEVYGGAMLLQNSTSVIINNTIYRNTCYNYGGGIVLTDPLSTEIQNNIFYDNYSSTGDRRLAIVSGDLSNVIEQYNFLAFGEMNPLFTSDDNLQLSPESPCIDEGNPDPQYNDVNGTRNDQGAFGGPGGDW